MQAFMAELQKRTVEFAINLKPVFNFLIQYVYVVQQNLIFHQKNP